MKEANLNREKRWEVCLPKSLRQRKSRTLGRKVDQETPLFMEEMQQYRTWVQVV